MTIGGGKEIENFALDQGDTLSGGHSLETDQVKILRAALNEAAVKLGPYDERILTDAGSWSLPTALVIASWINRAGSKRS